MKFKKADEMEMYINMQSTKWECTGVIYWTSNLYYRKELIGDGEKDEE